MAGELISFGTGVDWISKLWGKLWSLRKKYKEELESINLITFGDPLVLARFYVEPDCQDRNPADRCEEDRLLSRTPVMQIIDAFFRPGAFSHQHGQNQMFVLSDAGMGKTSLLTMLKLLHLTSFWPKRTDCILKKLGKTTIDEISKIHNQRETILLLDSLDEDPAAYGRVRERLLDILHASQHFFRVIITCRTQFFPEVEKDPLERLGMVSIGGFHCPVKYLSFFSDDKVSAYLSKRFPKKFKILPDKKKLEEARRVIEKMSSLCCRPMLLAYIEDLMGSPLITGDGSEFRVYDTLVQSWLNREKAKQSNLIAEDLLHACMILATRMQLAQQRKISEADLDSLIHDISQVRPIKRIELKGRSLLNRNSEGDYRFSHYSIQEFLVAKLLIEKPAVMTPEGTIPITDFILRMLSMSGNTPNFPHLIDCSGVNLHKADLHGLQLPGTAAFKGLDLPHANLRGANLCNADLRGTNFSNADLGGTNLSNADLRGARLRGADLRGSNLHDAFVEGAELDVGYSFKNGIGMEFRYIPPGKFWMGESDKESTQPSERHEVILTKGFFIQTTQVTQGQWKAVMGSNPSHFAKGGDDCPVETVSWDDAQGFIARLNEMERVELYRLPTEAEWEFACRAGSDAAYCFGDDEGQLGEYAWFSGNSNNCTHPVAQLKPNIWSLYDMHGNVWEWCHDWYGAYPLGSVTDPMGSSTGSDRVLRGGCWRYVASFCRSAYRDYFTPDYRFYNVGFRLSRSVALGP